MADTSGTTYDEMNGNKSAEFSDEPPKHVLNEAGSASSGSNRYRRSISGLQRDGRVLGMSGPATRRLSKNRHREQNKRLRIIVALLVVALIATTGASILSWNQKRSLEARVFEQDSRLRIANEDLREARDLFASQEAELRALRTGHLPGLSLLELNTQVDVDQGYIYKLTFLESGVGDDKRLEYHAILRNTSETAVIPRVKILLFDKKGIQTGMALIGDGSTDTEADATALKPGETRSYMSALTTDPGSETTYFLVEIN